MDIRAWQAPCTVTATVHRTIQALIEHSMEDYCRGLQGPYSGFEGESQGLPCLNSVIRYEVSVDAGKLSLVGSIFDA